VPLLDFVPLTDTLDVTAAETDALCDLNPATVTLAVIGTMIVPVAVEPLEMFTPEAALTDAVPARPLVAVVVTPEMFVASVVPVLPWMPLADTFVICVTLAVPVRVSVFVPTAAVVDTADAVMLPDLPPTTPDAVVRDALDVAIVALCERTPATVATELADSVREPLEPVLVPVAVTPETCATEVEPPTSLPPIAEVDDALATDVVPVPVLVPDVVASDDADSVMLVAPACVPEAVTVTE
jgi:hypothetical protein